MIITKSCRNNSKEYLLGKKSKQTKQQQINFSNKLTCNEDNKENDTKDSALWSLYFDGGSRGNPGVSGAGAVLLCDGKEVWWGAQFLGTDKTNNFAEYSGLILGLHEASRLNIKNLVVYGDSNLVVEQIKGNYKVKSDSLRHLYNEAVDFISNIPDFKISHIPREQNQRADFLSNQAMDSLTSASS